MNLSNSRPVVVITGASSGIGFATVEKLLKTTEFHLVMMGRGEAQLSEAKKKLSAFENRISAIRCDFAKSDAIQNSVSSILKDHKEIFALVNNAGIYPFGGITNTKESDWDHVFQVNLKSAFLLIQGLLPALKKNKNGARIINISSTAGLLPNHFALAYSVSKSALIQLTKTLAKELGPDGITVNSICPGIVNTPLHEAYHASRSDLDDFYRKRGAAFPLGRVGEPEDISGCIEFFLSDSARWITGENMIVDGGRLLI